MTDEGKRRVADPGDAWRLAALRSWMLNIERLALRVYANDRTPNRTLQQQVLVGLKDMADQLGGMATPAHLASLNSECTDTVNSSDCYPGFVCCQGVCVPREECTIPPSASSAS